MSRRGRAEKRHLPVCAASKWSGFNGQHLCQFSFGKVLPAWLRLQVGTDGGVHGRLVLQSGSHAEHMAHVPLAMAPVATAAQGSVPTEEKYSKGGSQYRRRENADTI